jgi:hypothetical protein
MENSKTKEELEMMELYEWVDGIPLSRTKKNINRDFSDAGTFIII